MLYNYKKSDFNNNWDEYFAKKAWGFQKNQYEEDLALAKKKGGQEVVSFLQDLRQQVQQDRKAAKHLAFLQAQCAANSVPDVFDPSQPIHIKAPLQSSPKSASSTNRFVTGAMGMAENKQTRVEGFEDVSLGDDPRVPPMSEEPAQGPANFQSLEVDESIVVPQQPTCSDMLASCLRSLRCGR